MKCPICGTVNRSLDLDETDGWMECESEVFHDVFDNNDIVVTEQTNANDIEEWDSLIHITLISAVEDEFDVSFDMKTVVSMKNVGDMIDAIEEQI